ncbi:MAG: hypothetical protein AABX66_03415, partial [Nanoarchaeota archaeon]
GNQIVIINKSGAEKTLQQAIDNKEFCTCGDNICQNGTGGHPNYGETNLNCQADCASETCIQDADSSGDCVGNIVCSNWVKSGFYCRSGDTSGFGYTTGNPLCSNCESGSYCWPCIINSLPLCGAITTLSEDYLENYCTSRGCNGVQRDYSDDSPSLRVYNWHCLDLAVSRFKTDYNSLMGDPEFYNWMSSSVDPSVISSPPPSFGGKDNGWYILSWGSIKENATINKLCEFFTGQYGMASLISEAGITGGDYDSDNNNREYYWNETINKWQKEEILYEEGNIDITSIYCITENGILPRADKFLID